MIFTITEEKDRSKDNSPLYTLDVNGDIPLNGEHQYFEEVWDRAAVAMRESDVLIEKYTGAEPIRFSYADVQEIIRKSAEFDTQYS